MNRGMSSAPDCEAASRDPWFKDCQRVTCSLDEGIVVARGIGCLEPTMSLYTETMEPVEAPGGPLKELLLEKATWLHAPPHAIANAAVASVTRRSVILEADAPPFGRIVIKVFKRPGGSAREKLILEELNGFPLIPRLLAVYEAEGTPYMLVYEAFEGEPLASGFIESGLETLWSGASRLPQCAAPLGHSLAALHAALGKLAGPTPASTTADKALVNAWIERIEKRAAMITELAPGDDSIAEAAETLRWLAGEWRRAVNALIGSKVQLTHGDLHLYQVYAGPGCRLFFTDFEGEPLKQPGSTWDLEGRERDLAALKRSITYAAALAAERATGAGLEESARTALEEPLASWTEKVFAAIRKAYEEAWATLMGAREPVIMEEGLRFWILERLSYELVYELAYATGYHYVPLWSLLKNPDSYAPSP